MWLGSYVERETGHRMHVWPGECHVHAGIRPEDGSNAIAACAAAISRMELGRLDEGTTANVGLISGGTSGNVVPGHCGIHAEARSLDTDRAAEIAGRIADACAWGASEHGCDVDVKIEELFRGYQLPKDSRALALAEIGLRGAGLEPVPTPFDSEEQVRRLATRLASLAGRRLDDAAPWVDARLPTGARLHAILPPPEEVEHVTTAKSAAEAQERADSTR